MKKYIIIFFIITCCILFFGCQKPQNNGYIKIINQIEQSIYIKTKLYRIDLLKPPYVNLPPYAGIADTTFILDESIKTEKIIELFPNSYNVEYEVNFKKYYQIVDVYENDTVFVYLINDK